MWRGRRAGAGKHSLAGAISLIVKVPVKSSFKVLRRYKRAMSKQFISGPVVLILEDEAIIALNLQDELQDAG